MANPFASPLLQGKYGGAYDLKRLVVNLYNNSVMADMGRIMRRDRRHRELAIEMLLHYSEYGEECPVFMEIARDLAAGIYGTDEESDSP
jgi:hypothetical protein